jgi:dethiobiotin synthetase
VTGFIVTGTDTGIGKTVIAAGLVRKLGARYWKPVQSGLEEETDREAVARLVPGAVVHPEAYRLVTPCSPHEAAARDGVAIGALPLPAGDGPLVVEGAGGVLVPLSDTRVYADQFAEWGLPVVLAARTSLGTINHTLLSLEALRARECVVAGVIFSGEENAETQRVIGVLGKVRVLGRVPRLDPLTPETLRTAFAEIEQP